MELIVCKKNSPLLIEEMKIHYSKPKGFVGRTICYAIMHNGVCYGHIVGGSATRFLPGRDVFLEKDSKNILILNSIVNNVFFHIEPKNGKYPIRNFSSKIIKLFEKTIILDWFNTYGDKVIALETLVELPRTGECYRRAGWVEVGVTKGFTCKRVKGKGNEKWGGKRIWDTKNLKPKLVLLKKIEDYEVSTLEEFL